MIFYDTEGIYMTDGSIGGFVHGSRPRHANENYDLWSPLKKLPYFRLYYTFSMCKVISIMFEKSNVLLKNTTTSIVTY